MLARFDLFSLVIAGKKARFNCVRLNDSTHFTDDHPAASLFREFFAPVLMLHLLFSEIAKGVSKEGIIFLQDLAEHFRVSLVYNIVQGVPINEGLFEGGMRMQVEVELYPLLAGYAPDEFDHTIDGWPA